MSDPEIPNQSETKEEKEKRENMVLANTFALLASEWLFVVLPLVVITIVMSTKGSFFEIISSPEWSFAAAVLFGQTIVKSVSVAIIRGGDNLHWERVIVTVAALIVIGLIPTLTILSLILVSDPISQGLVIAQIALFVLSVISYFFLAGAFLYGQASKRL